MDTKKTALVTGANEGIGQAIAKKLAREGFTVWVGSRDAARGQKAVEELGAEGLDAKLLSLDVSSDDSVAAAATALAQETDRLDVLVNNAIFFKKNVVGGCKNVECVYFCVVKAGKTSSDPFQSVAVLFRNWWKNPEMEAELV